jgi:hypothetical protein
MNRGLIVTLVGVGVLVLGLIFGIVGWYNTGVSLNESTIAQYRNNQNKYDAFWKSVQEVAQVPGKYKDDFKELLVAETGAKFGEGGSKAMFQWFKDREIKFDASLYAKVQTVIESGRADFKRGQQDLLDKQRRASTHYKKAWGKFASTFADPFDEIHGELRPPKDLDGDGRYTIFDYDIVTSAKTKRAFQTGEDDALNVFGK